MSEEEKIDEAESVNVNVVPQPVPNGFLLAVRDVESQEHFVSMITVKTSDGILARVLSGKEEVLFEQVFNKESIQAIQTPLTVTEKPTEKEEEKKED